MAMYIFKYLSRCGVCSRRKAAQLVKDGKVKVNGKILDTVFYVVQENDKIECDGKPVVFQKLHYILLNKPKDYLTTLADPRGRKTILDLITDKSLGRIYPVGRLDRMTTGLILLTNDGDFTQQLAHPSYQVQKGYKVVLDKKFLKRDFEKLLNGLRLEDGFIYLDQLSYIFGQKKNSVQLKIHSGRNRIVRRMFGYLGYKVKKLDRFYFAGLTKKGLPVGNYRFLTKEEIKTLKSFKKGKK